MGYKNPEDAKRKNKERYEAKKEFIKEQMREYYHKNKIRWDISRERNKKNVKIHDRNKNHKKKMIVMCYYSNGIPMCAMCGITDIDMLTIDHVNNNGAEHRKIVKGSSLYKSLIDSNFPEGFQVLCANHNLKKEIERHRYAEQTSIRFNGRYAT